MDELKNQGSRQSCSAVADRAGDGLPPSLRPQRNNSKKLSRSQSDLPKAARRGKLLRALTQAEHARCEVHRERLWSAGSAGPCPRQPTQPVLQAISGV